LKVSIKTVLVCGTVLLGLYGVNFVYAFQRGDSSGTFGDTFGAVNALFSGSALFFLVLAFFSQREELDLMKEERTETRKLISQQQELFSLQKFALDRQVFEQTFFSLLALINVEKSRLLDGRQDESPYGSELESISAVAEHLLASLLKSHMSASTEDVKLDLAADRAFNLVNLLSSAVALIETQQAAQENQNYFISLIQGIVDYHVAVCFAWYNFSSGGQGGNLANAYVRLAIQSSSSPTLRWVKPTRSALANTGPRPTSGWRADVEFRRFIPQPLPPKFCWQPLQCALPGGGPLSAIAKGNRLPGNGARPGGLRP
jgi:hypothetical protein